MSSNDDVIKYVNALERSFIDKDHENNAKIRALESKVRDLQLALSAGAPQPLSLPKENEPIVTETYSPGKAEASSVSLKSTFAQLLTIPTSTQDIENKIEALYQGLKGKLDERNEEDEGGEEDAMEFSDLSAYYFTETIPDSLYGTLIKYMLDILGKNEKRDILWFLIFLISVATIGMPCIVCFLLQGVLLAFLWNSLPELDANNSGFCDTDIIFQVALLASFYANMYQPLCDILWETYCVWTNEIRYDRRRKKIIQVITNGLSIGLKCGISVVILMESTIFCSIIVVGTKFILTSNGAANLIGSSLAIVFISDISASLSALIFTKTVSKDVIFLCRFIRSHDFDENHDEVALKRKERGAPSLDIKPARITVIIAGLLKVSPLGLWYFLLSLVFKPLIFTFVCVGVVLGLRFDTC